MSAANRVFRGPVDVRNGHPFVVEGTADAAFLPGAILKKTATGLDVSDVAATVFGQGMLIAKELGDHFDNGKITDTIALGDYAYAYRAQPGQIFNARVATGQALVAGITRLSRNGSGQLKVAVTNGTEEVVAIAAETITTTANNTLVDVEAL